MQVSRLTSKQNPLLKRIRLLASGSKRSSQDLVLAEGVRVLEEVINADRPIEAVVMSEGFGAQARERRLLNAWRAKKVPVFEVSERLFSSVSCVQSPQGALALVHVPPPALDDAAIGSDALILTACGIQDPGNLGTLIRTAVASGVSLFCSLKGTVSARNPKAIRASAGAFFHLPPVEDVTASDFWAYCRRHSVRLFRADAREGIIHTKADLRSACAIALGSEGRGAVPKEFTSAQAIRIPMAGKIESLNVAAAGAILLFEAARQRCLC